MAKKFLDEQGLTTLWGLVKSQIKTNIDALNGDNIIVGAGSDISIKEAIDGGDGQTLQDAKSYTDGKVKNIQDSFVNGGVKNPYALTFKNSGNLEANNLSYDGSVAKEIDLSPSALGVVKETVSTSYEDSAYGYSTISNEGASVSIKAQKTGSSGSETTLMVDKDGAYINNANIATEEWTEDNFPKLDSNNLIPASYLPSYVDDVTEYSSKTAFPSTGEAGKIYVALDTNIVYRWGGSTYVEISSSLALGETSSTAYPGDKGKTNASNIATLQGYFSSGIAKQAAKVTNNLTFSNTGNGAATGTTYNGSAAKIISYNSIGAVPAHTSGDVTAEIINDSGSITMTSATNLFSINESGIGMVYDTSDLRNTLSINENGLTYNENNVLDESMALTTAEIQAICV